MDIKFFNFEKYKIDVKDLKKVILFICKKQKLSGYIGISFFEPNKVKSYNKKYRNINKTTDVLSFSTETQKKNEVFGEIVICPEIAKKESISIKDLVIHGLIHLAGYDHKKNEKEWDRVLKRFQV